MTPMEKTERRLIWVSICAVKGRRHPSVIKMDLDLPAENPFLSPLPRSRIKQIYKRTALSRLSHEFTTKTPISIHTTTYNVASRIPHSLSTLFPPNHDIYVVGLQEVDGNTSAYFVTDTSRMETWKRLIEAEDVGRLVFVKQVVGLMILIYASSKIPISV